MSERDEADPNRNRTPDEDADFASEHESTTFADEMPGGPEGIKEPESPSGQAGDGGMDPGNGTNEDE